MLLKELLVTAIILNTNRREDTLECLSSLCEQIGSRIDILVLDNGSTDGSVEKICSAYPQVELIELKENRGYAGNNNIGLARAIRNNPDFVFILNEDTILAPDCIDHLVQTAAADRTIGILGPMVYHHDEPNVIQSAGGRLDNYLIPKHLGQNELDVGQFNQRHEVDWISGCAIMVRRETIEQVGMLDERFFYYWEELEWCYRAKKAGFSIMHVPKARLWHKGVQRNYQPSASVTYYNMRNRLLFLNIHKAGVLPWMRAIIDTSRTMIAWSTRPEKKEHLAAMKQGVNDFVFQHWGKMPEIRGSNNRRPRK
jgi:GT2 family glycosyltransferase